MAVTKEQIELLSGANFEDGRNGWEYVNLFEEDKREWVAKAILSCIEKGMKMRPDTISVEAGRLKYEEKPFKPTEEQLKRVPFPDFWEMQEKAKKYQESLPPCSDEDMIREMKSRGQYRPTGWPL